MNLADDDKRLWPRCSPATTERSAPSTRMRSGPTSMSHRSRSAWRVSCRRRRAPPSPLLFNRSWEGLRARGFAKSELTNLHLKRLSATTVIAGGVAVRSKTDGQELDRADVVYLLQKTNAGWQFATVVIHDADDALGPE
jgi:hypothetical protein